MTLPSFAWCLECMGSVEIVDWTTNNNVWELSDAAMMLQHNCWRWWSAGCGGHFHESRKVRKMFADMLIRYADLLLTQNMTSMELACSRGRRRVLAIVKRYAKRAPSGS